jgi:hypothetical protein
MRSLLGAGALALLLLGLPAPSNAQTCDEGCARGHLASLKDHFSSGCHLCSLKGHLSSSCHLCNLHLPHGGLSGFCQGLHAALRPEPVQPQLPMPWYLLFPDTGAGCPPLSAYGFPGWGPTAGPVVAPSAPPAPLPQLGALPGQPPAGHAGAAPQVAQTFSFSR